MVVESAPPAYPVLRRTGRFSPGLVEIAKTRQAALWLQSE